MTLLIVATSLMFIAGVALVVVPPSPDKELTIDRGEARELMIAGGIGAALAAAVFLLSAWPLPALVCGTGAAFVIRRQLRRQRSGFDENAKLEQLAAWIESVRDVLMAGEQPVGAIEVSASASGAAIRPHVRRLAAGLGRQDPDIVFRRFADDLDDPIADLVAAGLAIAIRRGARTVPVLDTLAAQTREQVDRRRLVDAERAPARREAQALTLIMGMLLIGLLVFGRSEYLDAYDDPEGQFFLSSCLLGYIGLIFRVQALATFPRPARFLTNNSRTPGEF